MSQCPATFQSNAIRRPSGDQRGVPAKALPSDVTWTACDPSLSLTQTSAFPDRSDSKAIRFPSGEYCGFDSTRDDEIRGAEIGFAAPAPGASTRQMFRSDTSLV